jgi:uncharacterized protein (TIGR02147 family)
MLLSSKDYRSYLKGVLSRRTTINPAYSLRAFARQLGLAPSSMSLVLQKKRHISLETAQMFARKLGLSGVEHEFFLSLVLLETSERAEERATAKERTRFLREETRFHNVSLDSFRAIADWYHLPIVEMTRMDRFEFSPPEVARRLGIPESSVVKASQRLESIGLIKKDPSGKFIKSTRRNISSSTDKNEAIRAFHKQMLRKAARAVDKQLPREKIIGSETFCFDKRDIEKARKLTEEFFTKIVALADQGKERTEIYHFGLQMFSLTGASNEKNHSI